METRKDRWVSAEKTIFDFAIIGGGINGACLYHNLCIKGHKVILVDKGDFSCGTSQASAMMIWGGLLYLRNLDILSVIRFSNARESMISGMGDMVSTRPFRYIPSSSAGRNKHFVHLGLYLYWLLGMFRRHIPLSQDNFNEKDFIKDDGPGSLLYEEAILNSSDSRFVMSWITPHSSEDRIALNYCLTESGGYSSKDGLWFLELRDTLGSKTTTAKARCVINCAGVWSDRVNRKFGITTPYKHVYSKGVFLGFKRTKGHNTPLIFEMGEHGDTLTYIPWGPVSLWGPTETKAENIRDGFRVSPEDIRFLLDHANKNLKHKIDKRQIVSLRCGIRPLAAKKSFTGDCYPLDISRMHRIVKDPDMPWLTAYGGKITGCISLASQISALLSKFVPPPAQGGTLKKPTLRKSDMEPFPGLGEKVPSVQWCMENEYCCTLEDYLRRRTCISQWIPREGLGWDNENLSHIKKYALKLKGNNLRHTEKEMEDYTMKVKAGFDQLIENV
ncbi:FAD-dependent oxidoreductase [Thermodesulfobacteriota bacterium]